MADSPQDLQYTKLRAEVRKLTAEAEHAELKRDALLRKERISRVNEGAEYVYQFFCGVTKDSIEEFFHDLGPWSRAYPGEAIAVVLNSPGGSVIDGLALYDELIDLRKRGHRVKVTVRGMAASMGGILLQAGDERVVGPNAHMLIHEISTGMIGKLSEIEDERKFCEMLADRLVGILAERSTLSVRQIKRRWARKDWWLGAQECVELGFCDSIG